MNVVVILVPPLVAAALACIPSGRRWWTPGVTLLSCLLVLVLAARLAWRIAAGASVAAELGPGWSNWVMVDGLSALILLLIAVVATTAAIFSVGYMGHGERTPRRLRLYYANYNLFVFSMLAIPLLTEPTLVWIVVELTTLCSALLVSFENTHEALEAAWKYVVLSLMGAGFALFGFLLLFAAMHAGGAGPYTWTGLIAAAPTMPPLVAQTAFLVILIGLGTKVGLVPMHTWLPDAHSQAPSPVCALLSGIETTTILYVILRLFPVMQAVPGAHPATWALVLGLISVGTAALLLLQVTDYKRLFAFSTVEHMGIILTAVGLGTSASYGAMQQIVTHSVTKSFCFFAAGAALLAVGTRQIGSVRGLIRRAPSAGAALLLRGSRDHRGAAACGLSERVRDPACRARAAPVLGDQPPRPVHRHRLLRRHAARELDGLRHGGRQAGGRGSAGGGRRFAIPPAVELRHRAAHCRYPRDRTGRLHSPAS